MKIFISLFKDGVSKFKGDTKSKLFINLLLYCCETLYWLTCWKINKKKLFKNLKIYIYKLHTKLATKLHARIENDAKQSIISLTFVVVGNICFPNKLSITAAYIVVLIHWFKSPLPVTRICMLWVSCFTCNDGNENILVISFAFFNFISLSKLKREMLYTAYLCTSQYILIMWDDTN